MANWQGMILTTKGRALQAKVEAGKTLLSLTKIKLGDGVISGTQTLEGLVDLVNPKQIIGITTIDPQSSGICKITGTVTNVGLETGYNIKELGLFATDPDDGEILYAVTTDSNFDYLQAEGGATIVSEEFNLSISISNTSQVTATIDATGLLTVSSATLLIANLIATHDDSASAHPDAFSAHNKDAVSHADIRAALKKAGAMPLGAIMPFLMTAPPAGWLALDTGALLSRATYPDLWTWVQANAPLITETVWQTQAAAQSSVGAYSSGDGSTTFRLPRILDYVRGGLTADVGMWQGDAIRNITGGPINAVICAPTGALVNNGTISYGGGGGAATATNVSFDASKIVPTADENRPKTIKMLYCVKAFDTETNQGLIDISELANEVAGKQTVLGYIKFWDEKPAGTHGGTFTTGAWRTRDLNKKQVYGIPDSVISLVNNQITLPAGTYHISIHSPAENVAIHRLMLFNVTDNQALIYGIGINGKEAVSDDGIDSYALIFGVITLTKSSILEIRHRCSATWATTGYGCAVNWDSVPEIYTVAEFIKLG